MIPIYEYGKEKPVGYYPQVITSTSWEDGRLLDISYWALDKWTCSYCRMMNNDTDLNCPHCGAPRG